ncbi:MAG: gamma-glutamyltransferase, partial [Gammaproteobacteria bacterium]|nr:gamma-glutamyltransferase [Gammaproteobacteria bacterium]
MFTLDKEPAVGSRGMIVTNHPLGSAAGAEMLAGGGNAIDAAVSALFALTVVEPMMVGIFGAGIANMRLADGQRVHINNYAVAPAAASADMYQTLSNTWPDYQKVVDGANDVGPLAIGVPGSLKGWCETLERFGRLSLDDVLQPAIRYAGHGFRATRYLSGIVERAAPNMKRFAETSKTFMPGGQPLKEGDLVVQAEYAATLKLLSSQGPHLLYGGELGSLAVDYLQRNEGLVTMEDLKNYRTVWSDPIVGTYRGYEVVGPPPPSAGGVQVTEMLNILEDHDVREMGFGSADSIHLLAEVMKIAFEDRKQYTGDPAFVDVPVAMLISKDYARRRGSDIDMAKARAVENPATRESNHTTHVTAADADGNVIATTQTIHSVFGSKVTIPGTGVLMNNTMNIFDPHPGLANSVAPGKRMTSSMSPTIVFKDGRPEFALGLPGAVRIFPSAMQAIVNVIDHGMSPQEAVEAPRVWTLGEQLDVEAGVPEEIRTELGRRGHRVQEVRIVGGGMGMIMFEHGAMTGASCWRADGTPIGVSGGMARTGSRFDV